MNIDNPSKMKTAAIAANLAVLNEVMTTAAKLQYRSARARAKRGTQGDVVGVAAFLNAHR